MFTFDFYSMNEHIFRLSIFWFSTKCDFIPQKSTQMDHWSCNMLGRLVLINSPQLAEGVFRVWTVSPPQTKIRVHHCLHAGPTDFMQLPWIDKQKYWREKEAKTLQLIKHQICTTSSMYHGNGPLASPIIWHSPYKYGVQKSVQSAHQCVCSTNTKQTDLWIYLWFWVLTNIFFPCLLLKRRQREIQL